MKRIKGLIAAPFTGFKEDGTIDLSAVEEDVKYCRDM